MRWPLLGPEGSGLKALLRNRRVEGVVQHNADENDQTNNVIVLKRRKAPSGLAIACQPKVVGHETRRDSHRREIPEAQ